MFVLLRGMCTANLRRLPCKVPEIWAIWNLTLCSVHKQFNKIFLGYP